MAEPVPEPGYRQPYPFRPFPPPAKQAVLLTPLAPEDAKPQAQPSDRGLQGQGAQAVFHALQESLPGRGRLLQVPGNLGLSSTFQAQLQLHRPAETAPLLETGQQPAEEDLQGSHQAFPVLHWLVKHLLGIKGLWGAITGKAIYSGTLDLKEAIEAVKSHAV